MEKTPKQKMDIAKAQLVIQHPFFAALGLRMEWKETQDLPTMATDGNVLWWNPDFVADVDQGDLLGVCVHECLHVANLHMTRKGARRTEIWHQATDYAINQIIRADGIKLPSGHLYDSRFDGMGAEEIYSVLDREQPDQGNQGGGQGSGQGDQEGQGDSQAGQDHGGCCGVRQAGKSPAEIAEAEQEARCAIMQAASVAKAAGKMPAGLERLIEELRSPHVDWREHLRQLIDPDSRTDYSWSTPNRRHIAQGLYLPAMIPGETKPLYVAVDTSGSIGYSELQWMAAEIQAISDDMQPREIVVIYCDSKVSGVQRFDQGEPIKLKPQGGGGTRFSPVFDWIDEQDDEEPSALVYLTDLCSHDFPAQEPDYPVIWAVEGKAWGSAPFGDVVEVQPNG